MKVRIIASGVAAAALVGAAVPLALSGSASAARAVASSSPPTITKCVPAVATIGKMVTIHGTSLKGATKVSIGGHQATLPTKPNGAKSIKVQVPTGVGTQAPQNVKVTTPNGTGSNNTACSFKKPKKSKK